MRFLLLTILLLPLNAHAFDVEVMVGTTSFQKQPDGVWYQNAFPHSLHLVSESVGIGITEYVSESIKYHVGYKYLGNVSSEALAVANDAIYEKYKGDASKYIVLGSWIGYGSVNMLYATLAPEIKYGDWTFALEAGVTLYRPSWTMRIYNYQAYSGDPLSSFTVIHNPKIVTGGTVGFSVKYKDIEGVLSVYDIRTPGDMWPALYHGLATNLSLRYQIQKR